MRKDRVPPSASDPDPGIGGIAPDPRLRFAESKAIKLAAKAQMRPPAEVGAATGHAAASCYPEGLVASGRRETIRVHRIRPAILGCALSACSTSAALPDTPSGLTCTAHSGAVLRFNVDTMARQFQKEGFPSLPMDTFGNRVLVLMRSATGSLSVEALLDRRTLVYTARSKDLITGKVTRTDYQCVAGPPFLTSDRR